MVDNGISTAPDNPTTERRHLFRFGATVIGPLAFYARYLLTIAFCKAIQWLASLLVYLQTDK